MAVNLSVPPEITPVAGVELGTVAAGLKKNGNKDLVLAKFAAGAEVAAVFTRNAYCAAPVTVAREHLQACSGKVSALLINSGGANAATGAEGLANARHHCQLVSEKLGVQAQQVLPFSTGVIGEQLPSDLMSAGIESVLSELGSSPAHWRGAAEGIMTTDTTFKQISRTISLSGKSVTVAGFAKGSGMIQPDMATMLSYVFTDAAVSATDLQALLNDVVERSFNSVTVDGDTSTNDACVLAATAASDVSLNPSDKDWSVLSDAVFEVCLWLSQALIRDGEGATKFITIDVSGGKTAADCKQIALTVGNSPLVKTAFFASDANLGRIIMAVGRSGIDYLDINRFSLTLGDGKQTVDVLKDGQPAADYSDEIGQAIMQSAELSIGIALGAGDAQWTCWASDLSHDYVSINADYRS